MQESTSLLGTKVHFSAFLSGLQTQHFAVFSPSSDEFLLLLSPPICTFLICCHIFITSSFLLTFFSLFPLWLYYFRFFLLCYLLPLRFLSVFCRCRIPGYRRNLMDGLASGAIGSWACRHHLQPDLRNTVSLKMPLLVCWRFVQLQVQTLLWLQPNDAEPCVWLYVTCN